MKKTLLFLLVFISISNCRLDSRNKLKISAKKTYVEKKNNEELKNWHYKDIEIDTIPGISLERAYDSLLVNKNGEEVILAVLDSEVNINEPLFKGNIWINEKEVANNNIDDDKNGYVDDVNGWNFIGNATGKSISYANYEYVRIIRKYQSQFKNKKLSDINEEDYSAFLQYKKAKKKHNYVYDEMKYRLKNGKKILEALLKAKEALKPYFPNENYSYEKLNKIDTVNNDLRKHVIEIKEMLDYNDSESNIRRVLNSAKNDINYHLNLSHNPREFLDIDSINDVDYGNNKIFQRENNYTHGTRMTSLILNKAKNEVNKISVMPVVVESYGDAHDQDIASGIYYAVNNGAKVINMSFGKEFSLYPKLVHNAFKYAEKNNVLIISSSGNDGKKLDDNFQQYPNDHSLNDEIEVSDNFLFVGSSSSNLNKEMMAFYSNYSNSYVDLFAPGDNIFTLYPNHKEMLDRGTSIAAAITSKIAALLYSYYPSLTASQIKHILMDSGLEYIIPISTPTKEDKNKTTPFNKLSKSGKVLNAYNAFIMADSIAKN